MKWEYLICLYTETHCTARGLRNTTIGAYKATLVQFRDYTRIRTKIANPDQVTARHVLEYLEYLRTERGNNAAAVNRQVVILKNFYRAIVAMGHLEPEQNPLVHFPKIKAPSRKLPVMLSIEEVTKLLSMPPDDTIIGLRDRAVLTLLYGTGIRASECSTVTEQDVDLHQRTITVQGKGGHQRTIPLNDNVVKALQLYRHVRGMLSPDACFFHSRYGRRLSRGSIYDRVRIHARKARITKRVSPHKLRHTFASHLVNAGVGIVTIRDLLGHRQITSTQIYLHVTAYDLREAARRHPIAQMASTVEALLPEIKLPFQTRMKTNRYG